MAVNWPESRKRGDRRSRWDRVEGDIEALITWAQGVEPLLSRLAELLDPVAMRAMYPVSIHARGFAARYVASYFGVLLEETGGDVVLAAQTAGIPAADLQRWIQGEPIVMVVRGRRK